MQFARLGGVLIGSTVTLLVCWVLSLAPNAFDVGFWSLRSTLVFGTGVLAIGLMSIAVILAARPVWFETPLGGLDKFYRLHKWLGISVLAFSLLHWLLRKAPAWITELGIFTIPARAPRPAVAASDESLFHALREPAAEIGDWVFYVLLILTALALWKRFPL